MCDLQSARRVAANGTELTVVETGSGDPLVLVHGGVSDLRTWSGQLDAFGEKFRTIAYSRRYHAPNPPIPDGAADPIDAHVDDLAALIVTLKAGPAHVVGHSWGGLIALLLALRHPELCRRLVLIESPAVTLHIDVPPTPPQLLRLFLASPRLAIAILRLGLGALAPAEREFRRGNDERAIDYLGRGILGKQRFHALSAERSRQVWDNRGPDRAQALHHGFPDLRQENLSALTSPVLLISGRESPKVFHLLTDSLAARLPTAAKRVIPGASHIVQEDAPGELNAVVLEFLLVEG